MLQPPFQSNKVPLSAEQAKTIAKCLYLPKKRVEVHVVPLRNHQWALFCCACPFGARQEWLKGRWPPYDLDISRVTDARFDAWRWGSLALAPNIHLFKFPAHQPYTISPTVHDLRVFFLNTMFRQLYLSSAGVGIRSERTGKGENRMTTFHLSKKNFGISPTKTQAYYKCTMCWLDTYEIQGGKSFHTTSGKGSKLKSQLSFFSCKGSLLSGSFLINSSLSAPTKTEKLTAGWDEKTQRSPAGIEPRIFLLWLRMVRTSKTDHFGCAQ